MLKSKLMILLFTAAILVGSWLTSKEVQAKDYFGPNGEKLPYTPVLTPNGSTLPWKMVGGVKEFHLVAEEIMRLRERRRAPTRSESDRWGKRFSGPCADRS